MATECTSHRNEVGNFIRDHIRDIEPLTRSNRTFSLSDAVRFTQTCFLDTGPESDILFYLSRMPLSNMTARDIKTLHLQR